MAAALYVRTDNQGNTRTRVAPTEVPQEPEKPCRRALRPRSGNWSETVLFAAAAVAVLSFIVGSGAQSLYRAATASAVPAVTIPVTVRAGDTLWAYAQKYGAHSTYILDRVEAIARTNHLPADAVLAPGERLQVPVTNPVLVAQIEDDRRLASSRK